MIKVGIVGLGKMGLSHHALMHAHPEVEAVACDSSKYVLGVLQKNTGVEAYGDYETMLGEAEAAETPIGLVPAPGELNVEGLDLAPEALEELLAVDTEQLREELPQVQEHLAKFGDRLPAEMERQRNALAKRLG